MNGFWGSVAAFLSSSTPAQWITSIASLGTFTLLVRFLPPWVRAQTERRKTDSEIARDLRDELTTRLERCERSHERMLVDRANDREQLELLRTGRAVDHRIILSQQDALALLMSEWMLLHPESKVVLRAKALLEVGIFGPPPDDVMVEAVRKLDEKTGGK